MGVLCVALESSSTDRELKFPLRANRNLTLPITPLSPRGSTLGRALEEIASDVIYFTVLVLSFSFLPPSLLPYLFMMFAVIGSGLSGHVAEILIYSLPLFLFPPPLQPPPPSPSLCCIWGSGVDAQPTHFTGSSSRFILSLLPFFCSSVSRFLFPETRFWRHVVALLSSKALSIME